MDCAKNVAATQLTRIPEGCLSGTLWTTTFHCTLCLLLATLHSGLHSHTKSLNSLIQLNLSNVLLTLTQTFLNLIWFSFKILHNIRHTHKLISDHGAKFLFDFHLNGFHFLSDLLHFNW